MECYGYKSSAARELHDKKMPPQREALFIFENCKAVHPARRVL